MMMALVPMLLYLAEEENRRRDENFRNFVPIVSPSPQIQVDARNSDMSSNATLDCALLHLLETGRFSDVQFQVGLGEYCFNCHKAIVGGRSEVLATAMEQRWTENDMENNVVPSKTVIRLPETNVGAFRVFLKYIYSDKLHFEPDEEYNNKLDLLLKVMSLSHMYQVPGLLNECVTQLTPKINVSTCWKIYKETRLIAPSLSEKCFKFLCDNIHEAAARNEYLKWDGETVQRILSLDRSVIAELNLFVALLKWRNFPTGPLEPRREYLFRERLLPLIRFPSMDMASFSKVIETKVLSLSENRRLRRYITNSNPRRRNTTIYNSVPRFTDTFSFKLFMYTEKCRTTVCSDDSWFSSEDNFMNLINSQRAEFSIRTNVPTIILGFKLHNVKKLDSEGNQCRFNLLITFQIYRGQSVLHKEERSMIIGGHLLTGPLISFLLRKPFQLNAGQVYEFHILYELLENDSGMEDENETYEYNVTWSDLSPLQEITNRRIGHGIIFKINYKVEDEDGDEDDIDHNRTPRWIHSVDLKSNVSHNVQQFCTIA